MNLKQLTAFREVMLTGSVSEAARNLYRTQPAISAMISGLEKELGSALFVRRNGRLHPVPEAHYLFEEAGEILEQLTATERNMKNLHELKTGVLSIACMPGPSVFFMPKLISDFVKNNAGIDVRLTTRTSLQVQQMIASQQYDVGLADHSLIKQTDAGLLEQTIIDCDCVCAMRHDDPLVDKDYITPQDLADMPLASLYADHPQSLNIRSVFQMAGVDHKIRFETQYFIPLFTYIENGLAYAIVDAISQYSYKIYKQGNQQLVFKPFLPRVPLPVSIMSPSHRPASNLAKAFTQLLKSKLQGIATFDPATKGQEPKLSKV